MRLVSGCRVGNWLMWGIGLKFGFGGEVVLGRYAWRDGSLTTFKFVIRVGATFENNGGVEATFENNGGMLLLSDVDGAKSIPNTTSGQKKVAMRFKRDGGMVNFVSYQGNKMRKLSLMP
jgi:hypothetical protein